MLLTSLLGRTDGRTYILTTKWRQQTWGPNKAKSHDIPIRTMIYGRIRLNLSNTKLFIRLYVG